MTYASCCGTAYVGRRYYTRDEKIAWLREYASELENELKAVKERIKDVQAEEE